MHVEQTVETSVEVTSEHHTVEETTQTVVIEEENHEGSSVQLTKDEIDEYEESQAKFRELWEKKREKVRFV